ncbi:DNA/RNA non-specific endonuclease [Nocardia huaxiensis]|uniref:DNA/RNA non-specific endonuclease n=1 Tax=Nocardia huaxiensis TaxID=2755382 RepID=UPI0023E8785D|nr:DNA/RNA non-specific endonuclease [Nocardia huaxiensis]
MAATSSGVHADAPETDTGLLDQALTSLTEGRFPAELFVMDGDPDRIAGTGRAWSDFGRATTDASHRIAALDTSRFLGLEATLFTGVKDDYLAHRLQITGEAYTRAGNSLQRYATELARLQIQMDPIAADAPHTYGELQEAVAAVRTSNVVTLGGALDHLGRVRARWDSLVTTATDLQRELNRAVETTVADINSATALRFAENPIGEQAFAIVGRGIDSVFDRPLNPVAAQSGPMRTLVNGSDTLSEIAGVSSTAAILPSITAVAAPLTAAAITGSTLSAAAVKTATGIGDWRRILLRAALDAIPLAKPARLAYRVAGISGLAPTDDLVDLVVPDPDTPTAAGRFGTGKLTTIPDPALSGAPFVLRIPTRLNQRDQQRGAEYDDGRHSTGTASGERIQLVLDPAAGYEQLTVPASGGGEQNFILINHRDAPVRYRFAAPLPADGRIEANPDGSMSIVDADGGAVAHIARPWAYDALGRPVATDYTADGEGLVQTVYPTPDSVFPILADPPIPTAPIPTGPLSDVTATEGRNTATWTVDELGRPVKATAILKEAFADETRGSAENDYTSRVGKAGGRDASNGGPDDGGHVIGHRFMRDQGLKNMFPQNWNFNRSAYKKLENEWAAWTDAGGVVYVDVELEEFDGVRPDVVRVRYRVETPDGTVVYTPEQETFDNESNQEFKRLTGKQVRRLMKDALDEEANGGQGSGGGSPRDGEDDSTVDHADPETSEPAPEPTGPQDSLIAVPQPGDHQLPGQPSGPRGPGVPGEFEQPEGPAVPLDPENPDVQPPIEPTEPQFPLEPSPVEPTVPEPIQPPVVPDPVNPPVQPQDPVPVQPGLPQPPPVTLPSPPPNYHFVPDDSANPNGGWWLAPNPKYSEVYPPDGQTLPVPPQGYSWEYRNGIWNLEQTPPGYTAPPGTPHWLPTAPPGYHWGPYNGGGVTLLPDNPQQPSQPQTLPPAPYGYGWLSQPGGAQLYPMPYKRVPGDPQGLDPNPQPTRPNKPDNGGSKDPSLWDRINPFGKGTPGFPGIPIPLPRGRIPVPRFADLDSGPDRAPEPNYIPEPSEPTPDHEDFAPPEPAPTPEPETFTPPDPPEADYSPPPAPAPAPTPAPAAPEPSPGQPTPAPAPGPGWNGGTGPNLSPEDRV